MKKGSKHKVGRPYSEGTGVMLFPDEEGIETRGGATDFAGKSVMLFPDEEGIETWIRCFVPKRRERDAFP